MPLKPSLRAVLAETHIADVAIAWLLVQTLRSTFEVLWPPFERALGFVFMAIAIMDIPYHSSAFDLAGRMELLQLWESLISALGAAVSAWTFSNLIYGVGPIRSLSMSCMRLRRSSDV
jgi:hypothetical protein